MTYSRVQPAALAVFSLLFTPAGLCGGGGGDDGPAEGSANCVSPDTLAPPADEMPTLTIGTGTGGELSSGVTLERFEGSQGGSHVNVSVRAYLPDWDESAEYFFDLSYSEGGSGSSIGSMPCAGQWLQANNQRLFLDLNEASSGTVTANLYLVGASSTPLATAEVAVTTD
jgi:hypothetical protein